MRFFFMAFLFLCVLSCRKEELTINIDDFIGKYLTCDSIKSIAGGRETITIKGRNTGFDIKLDGVKFYIIYSNPPQELFYKMRNPRIYYWKKNSDPRKGDFVKIISKEGKHLIIEHKDIVTKNLTHYYYTSE